MYLCFFISPKCEEADSVSGPLMPKCVNSISPISSKIGFASCHSVRVTFFKERPIILRQAASLEYRLTKLGTGSTMVCPACLASV